MTKHPILLPALVASLVAVACGGGYETEAAQQQCNDYRARLESCIDDAVYAQCVACFEECGADCALADANCPHSFVCPD
jgi:hypothetical protein